MLKDGLYLGKLMKHLRPLMPNNRDQPVAALCAPGEGSRLSPDGLGIGLLTIASVESSCQEEDATPELSRPVLRLD